MLATAGFSLVLALGPHNFDNNPTLAGIVGAVAAAVAAGEATVGLAIVIAIFRNRRTPLVDEYDAMRQ